MPCEKHPNTKTVTVSFCPACRGEKKSERKAASSRANGRKHTKKQVGTDAQG